MKLPGNINIESIIPQNTGGDAVTGYGSGAGELSASAAGNVGENPFSHAMHG